MARTAIPVTTLTANAATADVAGTAIDATNSHNVALGSVACEEIIIRVKNTTASTKVATIKAGANPPADAAGQGDIAVSLTDGSTTATVAFVGPLTSARFIRADGSINIDIGAGMTGAITVFAIPRGA